MNGRQIAKDILPIVLLVFLVVLCVATFLFAPVSVTLDGYSHLYNASALRWMLSGQPEAHGAFTYNSWLIPSWTTALLLAALSAVLPASLALRVLILLVGAAFVVSLYSCIDTKESSAGQSAQVFIVLLAVTLNAFLTLGFYDFVLSTAICFAILGFELRHGAVMPFRIQVAIAILLMIAWLVHPLPLALTFLFPVAMIAGEVIEYSEPNWGHRARILRAHIRILWPWALPLGLMTWFYLRLKIVRVPVPEISVASRLLTRLKLFRELAFISPSGNSARLFIYLTLVLLSAILIVANKPVIRSRRVSTLLVLGISTLLLFLVVPDQVGEGSLIPPRVLLFAVLFFVLVAFSKGIANPLLAITATTVSTLIVVGFAWEYFLVSDRMAPAVREVNAAMEGLPPHSRILIAGYGMAPGCEGPGLLERSVPQRHWAAAGAIGKELILLNDYEAYTSVFPLKYLNGPAENLNDEVRTGPLDNTAVWTSFLKGYPDIDYIVVWGTPGWTGSGCDVLQPPPFETALKDGYKLTLTKDGLSHVEIWRR